LQSYRRALDIYRQLDDSYRRTFTLLNLGVLYSTIGESQRGVEFTQEGLALARRIGERRAERILLLNLGEQYWDLGNRDRAIAAAERGLALAAERPELQWTARRTIARAEVAAGDAPRAIDELRAAARTINDLRANVGTDASKIAFVNERQAVFHDLAALLVDQ